MKQSNTFSVTFYQRKDKIDDKDTVPIVMRITVNGERANISLNRRISINLWDDGRAVGTSAEVKNLNKYLDSCKAKVLEIQRYFVDRKEIITAEKVKNRFLGLEQGTKTIMEIFEIHNNQLHELIGKDFSIATYQRYLTTLNHVKDFLQYAYKKKDMYLHDLKFEFITNFEHYLKTKRDCNHNTAIKYVKNFRKVINMAIKNDWIEKDPFAKYTSRIIEVDRGFLSHDELNILESKTLTIPRLDIVRDIFVFACYTGLAYVDVAKLNKNDIQNSIDGKDWIRIRRTKTETKSNIPLLPKAKEILGKYSNHPEVLASGTLLPVSSNQKMNAYLKEIADVCGIDKNLTFHLARHTFATTVTLTNGVPIETVSSMLGHKSMRTTQIYAKVIEAKVGEDMAKLEEKLSKL